MSTLTGTVLVADDDASVAEGIASALRPQHDVRVAYGGEEALHRLDDSVDVVLLDRRMPDLSGDAVLDAIRERAHNCRVAMVTAVEPDPDIVDMPFDDYVMKPVSGADLRAAVEHLLRRSAYDSKVRELYALAAKRAALAGDGDGDGVEESGEYESLRERFERLDAELAETARTLEAREAFETATDIGAD